MPTDDFEYWRTLINSYEGELPDGNDPPQMEMIAPEPHIIEDGEVFVQKVITEMYIFTDVDQQIFGEHTFQDMVILGTMSKEKLARLLNRQRRKRQKGS